MKPRIITIKKNILDDNDQRAHRLRDMFAKQEVFVINVVSSPGSGKTELLSVLAKNLIEKGLKVCAIVGDLATENDAIRLKKSGAETFQINTNGNCHLDTIMIEKSLKEIHWKNADILFIENVGNLVCPAAYDLGENLRIVILSVTEGEDKPSKYPTIFNSADIAVISKIDLAEAVNFNEKLAIQNIQNVHPTIKIMKTSARKNVGIDELADKIVNLAKGRYE